MKIRGAKYHIGDTVEVQVAAVNLDEKKIDLALAGANAVIKRAKAADEKQKLQISINAENARQLSQLFRGRKSGALMKKLKPS